MTRDEFLYDYTLEYVSYMVNKYAEENYKENGHGENAEVQSTVKSNVYRITDVL